VGRVYSHTRSGKSLYWQLGGPVRYYSRSRSCVEPWGRSMEDGKRRRVRSNLLYTKLASLLVECNCDGELGPRRPSIASRGESCARIGITPGWASRFADGLRAADVVRPGQRECRQGVWVRWQRRPRPSLPRCRRPACFRDGISTPLSSRGAPQLEATGGTETGWQAGRESGRVADVGALWGGREIPGGPR